MYIRASSYNNNNNKEIYIYIGTRHETCEDGASLFIPDVLFDYYNKSIVYIERERVAIIMHHHTMIYGKCVSAWISLSLLL